MATSSQPAPAPVLPAGRRVCPECGAVFTTRRRGGSPLCRVCAAKKTTAYLYQAVEHRDRARPKPQDD